MTEAAPKPLPRLDVLVDAMLAYHPKPKSKPAKKRKRHATAWQKLERIRREAGCELPCEDPGVCRCNNTLEQEP